MIETLPTCDHSIRRTSLKPPKTRHCEPDTLISWVTRASLVSMATAPFTRHLHGPARRHEPARRTWSDPTCSLTCAPPPPPCVCSLSRRSAMTTGRSVWFRSPWSSHRWVDLIAAACCCAVSGVWPPVISSHLITPHWVSSAQLREGIRVRSCFRPPVCESRRCVRPCVTNRHASAHVNRLYHSGVARGVRSTVSCNPEGGNPEDDVTMALLLHA